MSNEKNEPTFAELYSESKSSTPADTPNLKVDLDSAHPDLGYYTEINDFKCLSNPPSSYYDPSVRQADRQRLKKGTEAIKHPLDLHGYTKKKAVDEMEARIQKCQSQDQRYLLVIFGKGKTTSKPAVLKPVILSYLIAHPEVLAYELAKPKDGGTGAAYVLLKRGIK